MSTVFDYIDRPTFDAALDSLALTEAQLWALSGDDFGAILEDRHFRPLREWIARNQARTDQMETGRRRMGADRVPADMPLYEAAQAGIIDMDDFRDAMQTLLRVQVEDEADPSPHSEAVGALLLALQTLAEKRSAEESGG